MNLRLIRKAMLTAMAALFAGACGGGSSSSGGEGSSVDTITITSNAAIDCLQANPMSVTLQATGNSDPLTWNVTKGTLPAGLSLDSSDGRRRRSATEPKSHRR